MGVIYECAYCNGRGRDAYYSSSNCRSCGGSGQVFIPYDNAVRCGRCGGSGRDPYYSTDPCQSCGGAGVTAPGIRF